MHGSYLVLDASSLGALLLLLFCTVLLFNKRSDKLCLLAQILLWKATTLCIRASLRYVTAPQVHFICLKCVSHCCASRTYLCQAPDRLSSD